LTYNIAVRPTRLSVFVCHVEELEDVEKYVLVAFNGCSEDSEVEELRRKDEGGREAAGKFILTVQLVW
jgi:hypothetical protein